jgi:uncharacterized protein YqeY
MSLLQTIKSAQLTARKARNSADAASLTTLIGEAEAIGKNNGNREVTDAEVVALVKKFIKNNVETSDALKSSTAGFAHQAIRIQELAKERELYTTFLPAQLTEEKLRTVLSSIVASEAAPKMGDVLKRLKANYEGQYDGALASKIKKELLV